MPGGKFITRKGPRTVTTAIGKHGTTRTYNAKTRKYSGTPEETAGLPTSHAPTVIETVDNGRVTSTITAPTPQAATRKTRIQKAQRERRQTRRQVGAILARREDRRKSQPNFKPAKALGMKTAGTPTNREIAHSLAKGNLAVDKHGAILTPKVAQARAQVGKATRIVRRSNAAAMKDLSPQEAEVARLAKQAHRKYPEIKTSVLMGDTQQESNFDAAADSGVAGGLTQFIPSTAATYGVKYGTGKKEKRSQVMGQAHYLTDLAKQTGSVKEALGNYYGDPSAPYSDEVLAKAQAYKGLDRPSLKPGQRRKVQKANQLAAAAGIKARVGAGGAGSQAVPAGPPPKKVVTRFKAIKAAAHALEAKNFPYSWGGGHVDFRPGGEEENGGPGYDCSGAVSYVLHKAGVLDAPLASGSMGSVLEPGPGAVTVFYNGEHTFMRIGNEYWGTSVGDAGAGGIGKHPAPSADYLAGYSVGHVPGLGRKQALQLGFKDLGTGGAASFPGMTLSPSGTTATVDTSSHATTGKTKAGFSKVPILPETGQQKLAKVKRITGKGGALTKGKSQSPEGEATLADLEKRYGSPAV